MTFPPEWGLSPTEQMLLRLLARSAVPLTTEQIEYVVRPKGKGRRARVVIHYLRGKLAPLGLSITTRRTHGFELPPWVKANIAKTQNAGSVP